MSETPSSTIESSVPLFDVVINVPPGARLQEIERLSRDIAGISSDRVDRLMQVLRSSPQAKIGSGVTREKADLAHEQFSKAGLLVTVTPVLSIQTAVSGSHDGQVACPACEQRVVLTPNRQCPSCSIFVDKVTDEFLLRRKLMKQERGRIEFAAAKSAKDGDKRARDRLEASLRAEVRKELEKEYGIQKEKRGWSAGLAGSLKVVGVISLVAAAFMGGRSSYMDGLFGIKSASAKNLETAMFMPPENQAKTAQGGATEGPGAATEPATVTTGDADIDDPLIQAAGGKRMGAKGLTIEQAVAAAQILGKSVGNTTAERALSGAAGAKTRAGATSDSLDKQAASALVSDASQSGVPSDAATSPVSQQTRLTLTAELARTLAELGQTARARGVLKATMALVDPVAEPEAAAALRSADIRAQAWALQRREAGATGKAAADLKAQILAVVDPVERMQLLGQAAVILSRGAQLAPELPRALLSLAADPLKSVTASNQSQALGDLAVAMGEVFANETSALVRAGMWSKARASAAQIDQLLKQAPNAWTQLRLHALDHRVQQLLGRSDNARQSLHAALTETGKNSNLTERAIWLHSVAQLADAASEEPLDAVTASLQAQLENKSGMEKAQSLTQLSLLYAQGGLPARAERYRSMAQSTPGLSRIEATSINANLIVRSDLAMARVLQGLGRHAEAESLLQRVGGYLL